jgi:hypothetical protein
MIRVAGVEPIAVTAAEKVAYPVSPMVISGLEVIAVHAGAPVIVAGLVYDKTPAVEAVTKYPLPAGANIGSVHDNSSPVGPDRIVNPLAVPEL